MSKGKRQARQQRGPHQDKYAGKAAAAQRERTASEKRWIAEHAPVSTESIVLEEQEADQQ